jgi:hypothetical protein
MLRARGGFQSSRAPLFSLELSCSLNSISVTQRGGRACPLGAQALPYSVDSRRPRRIGLGLAELVSMEKTEITGRHEDQKMNSLLRAFPSSFELSLLAVSGRELS